MLTSVGVVMRNNEGVIDGGHGPMVEKEACNISVVALELLACKLKGWFGVCN